MNTHIFYRKKFFIHAIIYLIAWGLLGMLTNFLMWPRYLNILLGVIILFPVLLLKSVLKKYTRSVFVEFSRDFFIFIIFNQKGISVRKKFDLNNLKSYCVLFPNERFNSIKFQLKDGKIFEYSFFKRKTFSQDIDTKELINSIVELIYE